MNYKNKSRELSSVELQFEKHLIIKIIKIALTDRNGYRKGYIIAIGRLSQQLKDPLRNANQC